MAFFRPQRLAIFVAQALSQDYFVERTIGSGLLRRALPASSHPGTVIFRQCGRSRPIDVCRVSAQAQPYRFRIPKAGRHVDGDAIGQCHDRTPQSETKPRDPEEGQRHPKAPSEVSSGRSRGKVRFRVEPRDLSLEGAACRLDKPRAEFQAILPNLLARGFPQPDSDTGNFDLIAIDKWCDGPTLTYSKETSRPVR
jgi:hypothetical protein